MLMPRLRKRPPARESGASAAGKEGGGDFFFPRCSSVERSRIIVYIMNMRSERGEVQYRVYSLAGIGGAQILNSLTISFGNAASGISSELGLWMELNLFYKQIEVSLACSDDDDDAPKPKLAATITAADLTTDRVSEIGNCGSGERAGLERWSTHLTRE